jgi:hypothetical protein
MGHVQLTRSSGSTLSRPPRKATIRGLILIGILAAGLFAGGFVLLWTLGGWIAGGKSASAAAGQHFVIGDVSSPGAYSVPTPFVDLRTFRDLSYVPIKGLHVTAYAVGATKMWNGLLALADRTEINSFVMDLKDESGYVAWNADVPLAKQLGLIDKRIKDIDAMVTTLQQHKLVPIGRIVCFKDPVLAKKKPDWAIMSKQGGVWKDYKGVSYVNPYNREVWKYLGDLAVDAANHGFREIQFDYVRFPSDGKISDCLYPGKDRAFDDNIAAFLAYARSRLEPLGVWVSADVFGLTVQVNNDMGIGQRVEKVAENVDIVSPMTYPSHYTKGSYGFSLPWQHPYELLVDAMKDSKRRLAGTGAMTRPWLQDFSLSAQTPKYGIEEVKAQIKACEDEGIEEWILWDPALTYTEGALRPK